jgi:hypothetical protein
MKHLSSLAKRLANKTELTTTALPAASLGKCPSGADKSKIMFL